jgi:transcription elongation factor/antiterminator RfaH
LAKKKWGCDPGPALPGKLGGCEERMNFCSETEWYAIYARPGAEEQARRSIESLELETFLPRVKQERICRSAARRWVKPLFPGYLFARFCPAQHLHKIRFSRGVRRVVGAGDTPIPVEPAIISEISARMAEDGFVRLEPKSWRTGDAVEIKDGPLQGWSGVFEQELPDQRRVVILLNAIQQARIIVQKQRLQELAENQDFRHPFAK